MVPPAGGKYKVCAPATPSPALAPAGCACMQPPPGSGGDRRGALDEAPFRGDPHCNQRSICILCSSLPAASCETSR